MAKIARVGIVGGGVAGLTAAVALAGREIEIELFEAADQLGGRALTWAGASAACDVNLARFLVQISASKDWELESRLHLYSPQGKRNDLTAVPGLPAPLHLLTSLFRLSFLSFRERWNIAKALIEIGKPIAEEDEELSILRWLRLHDQSRNAIERFWTPLLIQRLGTGLESASLAAARQALLDRFLQQRAGYGLRIPQRGLEQCLVEPAEKWLLKKEVRIHLSTPVRLVLGSADRCQGILLESGDSHGFDLVIVAAPWRQLGALLSGNLRKAIPELDQLEHFAASSVRLVNLWFDRPLTPLSHALLSESVIQEVYRRHPRAAADRHAAGGFHYQAVLNAENLEAEWNNDTIMEQVRLALSKAWPACRDAVLLDSRVTEVPQARFPCTREFENNRPNQVTSAPNLMLAGDWTNTGKPSSLESAIRSGYLAAEAVLEYIGCPAKLLAPEPTPEWLARRLFKLN